MIESKPITKAEDALLLAEEKTIRSALEACDWSLGQAALRLELPGRSSLAAILTRHPELEKERRKKSTSTGGRPRKPVPLKTVLRAALIAGDWNISLTAEALETAPVTLMKWIRLTGLDEECPRLSGRAAARRAWAKKQGVKAA